MRTFEKLFEGVIGHEGYYANKTGDIGGETYMGVARKFHPRWQGWEIVDAYKAEHGGIEHNKEIDSPELLQSVKDLYKEKFYDKFRISDIYNGSLQEIIFDWCVNSRTWGSRGVQRVLNQSFDFCLKMDGLIGKRTLSAINSCDPEELFDAIKTARINFYIKISKNGKNRKFLKGWLRRIDKIRYRG